MSALKTNAEAAPREDLWASANNARTGQEPLEMALENSCPSPLATVMEQQLGELELHTLRATVEGAPIIAERRLASLPRVDQERILKDFLEHNPAGARHWLTYPYASIPTFSTPRHVESESRYTVMCASLLKTGLLPGHEVEEALTTLALNSKDRLHDDQTVAFCGLVSLGVIIAGTLNSQWITGAAIICGAILCNRFINRLDPREELFTGFILEGRDAFIATLREELPDLQSTLEGTFNNPTLRAHFQRELQKEGFLAARTLRLLGVDPVTIAELFDRSTRREATKSFIAEKLKELLTSQGHRLRASLTHTLEQERETPKKDSLSNYLEVLNRAYFTWAIHEKHAVRESFACAILSAT